MKWENDTFLRRAKRTKETIRPHFKNKTNGTGRRIRRLVGRLEEVC